MTIMNASYSSYLPGAEEVIYHPLDDPHQEIKCDANSLGPMKLTLSVKFSLLVLRLYLVVMFSLVLIHIWQVINHLH